MCRSKSTGSGGGGNGNPSGGKSGGKGYKNRCYVCGGDHKASECPKRWKSPSDVNAVGDNQSVGSADTIPVNPASRNGTIDAVLVQTLTEVYEQDWVLAVDCEGTDDEVECGGCGACPYYNYDNKCECGCSDNEVHWIMAAEAPEDEAPEEEALEEDAPADARPVSYTHLDAADE